VAEEARKLHEQAVNLYLGGKYREGIPIAERALDIREQALGSEHPDSAASMRNLVQLYRVTGAFSKAEALCKRVLEIRERTAGAEHPDTAESLDDLAILYTISSAYTDAEPLHQRAFTIREKALGAEHPDTAKSLNNLSRLYQDMGLYSRAEPLAQRALAIREKILGPEHPATARSVLNLANTYRLNAEYAKSESLHLRALAIQEKVQGPEHPDTAEALAGVASIYNLTGGYLRAIQLLERAIAIREKVAGSKDSRIAFMLNVLAVAHQNAGDHARAEVLLQRALQISEDVMGSMHPDTADALGNLALLHIDFNEPRKAEPLLLRALAIKEKTYGQEHADTAAVLDNLGIVYNNIGAYSKAESLQLRALAINEKLGTTSPQTAFSLRRLGLAQWMQGNSVKALLWLQRAQKIQAKNSDSFLISGSESRKQDYQEALSDNVFINVSFSLSNTGRDSVALGLTSVLQYKGRTVDAMSDNVARLRQSVRAEDRTLFEELAEVAQQLSTLTYRGVGRLSSDVYRQRVDYLSRQQDALEAQLAKNSSRFRRQMMPATLSTVRGALPADAVLVEWLRYRPFDPKAKSVPEQFGSPRYVAYALKRLGDPVAIDLGTAESIDRLVSEFRLAASNPQRSDVRQRATALSKRIIEPLRLHISGARHLLLSPDSALNLIPMAALVDERARYLGERYEITYLTSGRDLLRIAVSESAPSSNAVIVADPDFGQRIRVAQADPQNTTVPQERSEELDRSGLIFRSLPGAALEAEAIRQLLQSEEAHVFTGAKASEANLKRLHGPRILHLATHGFFLSDQELRKATSPLSPYPGDVIVENPLLRSGLALAGANQRRSGLSDDGILTALEASRLDLRGTELVVLSACETGVGEVSTGSGITGLRRGLLLAGAQTQVSSLWKVADLPTKELMTSFYRQLVSGKGRSAALRRAQREMLANAQQSHPYYWAGFVSIGDWRPLSPL
jgi:CHAT domain-containing protein